MADCDRDDLHTHHLSAVLIFRGTVIFDGQENAVALSTDPTIAARIVELLERHGFADIPDTPEGITTP